MDAPPGPSSPATRTDVEPTRLAPRIAGWILLAWAAWAVVGAL